MVLRIVPAFSLLSERRTRGLVGRFEHMAQVGVLLEASLVESRFVRKSEAAASGEVAALTDVTCTESGASELRQAPGGREPLSFHGEHHSRDSQRGNSTVSGMERP